MERRNYLFLFYEILRVAFVPFIVVLFIEFILRFGMGPFIEELSFNLAVFASIIAICSYVWIKRGIIYAFFPVIVSSVVIALFRNGEMSLIFKLIHYFISILILTFISVLIYAISKVIRKHGSSYHYFILQFFLGIFLFVLFTPLINIALGFLNPQVTIIHSLVSGIRDGLVLGSGVSIIVIILSQKPN
ncbi:hypothetical protein KAU34_05135 [candidate division WOR-3 bacterium]|nr:hypothetical protein [candidate division WOR-3 bacterium]